MQAVPWSAEDPNGETIRGIKWILPFGELSVRREGRYRLQVDAFELIDGISEYRGCILTADFYTFTPKEFPGMGEATETTVHVKTSGVRLRASKTHHFPTQKLPKRLSVRFLNPAVTHDLVGSGQRYGISHYREGPRAWLRC